MGAVRKARHVETRAAPIQTLTGRKITSHHLRIVPNSHLLFRLRLCWNYAQASDPTSMRFYLRLNILLINLTYEHEQVLKILFMMSLSERLQRPRVIQDGYKESQLIRKNPRSPIFLIILNSQLLKIVAQSSELVTDGPKPHSDKISELFHIENKFFQRCAWTPTFTHISRFIQLIVTSYLYR